MLFQSKGLASHLGIGFLWRSLSVIQWWRGLFDALGGLAAAFDCEVVCILIIWVKFKGGFGRLGSLTRLSVGWLLRCV